MAEVDAPVRRRYRFGAFEVNENSRELLKDGRRVPLQELPFRVLLFLLQRGGDLVTRGELHKELWPDGTYVEFEQGLNTAIRKVRRALEDDADSPEFIETVPRQGYRFLVVPTVVVPPTSPPPPATVRTRRFGFIPVAAALVLASTLLWFLWRGAAADRLEEHLIRNPERLTADAGLTWQPSISPDGALLAFSSDRAGAGNLDIWVMHVGAGNPVRLTDDPADDTEPHFCPDGRVVFRSDRNGGGVYIVPALGGRPTLLASGGRGPRCSPDGKSVAFWIGVPRGGGRDEVFIVPSGGGSPVRVSSAPARARRPIWSPDGTKLLVLGHANVAAPWHETDWWLVDVAGGAARPLGVTDLLQNLLESTAGVPDPADWNARTGEVLFSARLRQADYATWRADLWSIPVHPGSLRAMSPLRHLTSATGEHSEATVAADGTVVFADLDVNPISGLSKSTIARNASQARCVLSRPRNIGKVAPLYRVTDGP